MTTGNARFKIDTNTLYDHLYLNCYFSLTRQLTLRSIEDMPNETSTTHSADPRSFLGCQGAGFAIISPQSQCRCKRHKRSRVDLSPCAEPKSLQRPCQRAGRQSQPSYGVGTALSRQLELCFGGIGHWIRSKSIPFFRFDGGHFL